MQWIEVTIKTAPGAIDLVCDRLTVLGFDSFIVDDQDQFHEFLEENRHVLPCFHKKGITQDTPAKKCLRYSFLYSLPEKQEAVFILT